MMVTWGVPAGLGGQWEGRRVDGLGEWIRWHAQIPAERYRELAAAFDPAAFDADALVGLAKDAGMRYLVFIAKHHDGFALFDSAADPFNSVHHARWGRDAVREVADACRRHGVRLGLYYSHAIDWNEPNAAQHWADPDASGRDFDEFFRRKSLPQIRELLTNYGEVSVLWPDMPFLIRPEQCQEILDLTRELQPECLVCSRLGWSSPWDYRSFGDNELPNHVIPERWETVATLNDTWGFRSDDHAWKSPEEVLTLLLAAVGKGGNLLLNVGPDGDGRVPEPSQEVLREVGRWLGRHGDAVYGAEPSPFPYDLPSGPVTRTGEAVNFFAKPGAGPPSVAGLPAVARWQLADDAPYSVHRAILEPGACVDPMPQPQGDGEIRLPAALAELCGGLRLTPGGHVAEGTGELAWEFQSAGGTFWVWAQTVWPDHRENGGRWADGGSVALADSLPVAWRADRLPESITARYYDVAETLLGTLCVESGPSSVRVRFVEATRAHFVCLILRPQAAEVTK